MAKLEIYCIKDPGKFILNTCLAKEQKAKFIRRHEKTCSRPNDFNTKKIDFRVQGVPTEDLQLDEEKLETIIHRKICECNRWLIETRMH